MAYFCVLTHSCVARARLRWIRVVDLHRLLACADRLEALRELMLVICQPESDSVSLQSRRIRIISLNLRRDHISQALLQVVKALFSADLRVAYREAISLYASVDQVVSAHDEDWNPLEA